MRVQAVPTTSKPAWLASGRAMASADGDRDVALVLATERRGARSDSLQVAGTPASASRWSG